MSTEPTRLAVGGENLIDHVTSDGAVSAKAGGSPYNVAMALGRQGADVRYVSPISTDSWGADLADTLELSGVRLSGGRSALPTTMARVTITDGIPSYRFERDGTAERAITDTSLRAAIGDAQALHTGSLALIDGPDAELWEAQMARAFDAGCFVSLDPNVRLSVIEDLPAYRARILRMIRKVHLLKLSDEDLEGLFPGAAQSDALAEVRSASNAGLLVLTRGADGAQGITAAGQCDIPAAKVDALVDTVGAGDTFMATLLATLAAQGKLSAAGLDTLDTPAMDGLLRRASAAAAINCGREGCDPPTAAELAAAGH